jgi:hypothetical protein
MSQLFISKVCDALAAKGVRYALAGGHAVSLHGAVRGTVDIDVVINWDQRSLRNAGNALGEIGLVSRLPITAENVFQFRDEYIENRNLIAWNFYNPENLTQQVDIIISYDLKGKRRQRLDTSEGPIYILDIRELIEMKRASGRPQDLSDVDALEKLR